MINNISALKEKNRELEDEINQAILKYKKDVGFLPDIAVVKHENKSIGTEHYQITVEAVIA